MLTAEYVRTTSNEVPGMDPGRESGRTQVRITFILATIAVAMAASACGDSENAQPASAGDRVETEALQERVEKLEGEAKKRKAEAARKLRAAKRKARAAERKASAARRAAKRRRKQVAETEAVEVSAGGGGGGIVVPNVVGLDHQAAQDALQGEGLWMLEEEDCTGQDRMLLWDRNWEVVSTDPPPGTPVNEDTTITICSKKQGE